MKRQRMRSAASMTQEDVSRASQEVFNEAVALHGKYYYKELLEGFRTKGFSCLRGARKKAIAEHGIEGKAIAHLCCSNGRELLSLKNLGAGRCVGFDIAEDFLAHAREFAAAGGIDCTFECCDVYQVPASYDAQFDIVFVSPGTLFCMVDLKGFFEVAARLLKPEGWLFINEIHPLTDVYLRRVAVPAAHAQRSYFDPGPFATNDGLDYCKGKRYRSKPFYITHHKMSDIIQACIDSGLLLESFEEHAQEISRVLSYGLRGLLGRFRRRIQAIPKSYVLTARRRAE